MADFDALVSELQGELNASHLGCYFRSRNPNADATATLAFFPEVLGWSVKEIEMGGDPVKMLANGETYY